MLRRVTISILVITITFYSSCNKNRKEAFPNKVKKASPKHHSIHLKKNIPFESAITTILNAGAKKTIHSIIPRSLDDGKEYKHQCFTLPNGITVFVTGEGLTMKDLSVNRIRICNSTMLFCCKSVHWVDVDEIIIDGDSVSITLEEKVNNQRSIIHTGMNLENLNTTLAITKAREVELTKELAKTLRQPNQWKQYHLNNKHLLVEYTAHHTSSYVKQLILSKSMPSNKDQPGHFLRVKMELIDLNQPFGNKNFYTLPSKCTWTPEKDNSKELQLSEQR